MAFGLRAYRLDGQSLWSDESISLERATQPLPVMLRELPVEHAPLYFVLLHGWLRLAGSSDFALRYPSLWMGVLAVPLVSALGRRLLGRRLGLLAGLLLTVQPLALWYSQEARMYALATATGVAALWLLAVGLQGRGRWPWLGYSLAGAATLYTHYYGGLIVAIGLLFGLVCLWLGPSRNRGGRRLPFFVRSGAVPAWPAFAAAEAGIGLLFLPWLPRAVGVLGFPGWRPPVGGTELARILLVRFPLGPTLPAGIGLGLGAAQFATVLVGLVSAAQDLGRRRRLGGASLLLVSAAVTTVALAAILHWRADIHERYLLPIAPLWCLALAVGLVTLWRHERALAATMGFLILASNGWSLANHYFDSSYAKPDYRDYTAYVVARATPHDALVLYGPGYFLTKRYGGEQLPKIINLLSRENRKRSAAGIEVLLAEVVEEHPIVWLAIQGRESGAIGEWFARNGFLLEGGWRTGLLLCRYVFPRTPDPPWQVISPRAGRGGVGLTGFARLLVLAGKPMVLVAVRVKPQHAEDLGPLRVSARWMDEKGISVVVHDVDCVPVAPCPDGNAAVRCGYVARVALPLTPATGGASGRVAIVVYRALDGVVLAEATLARLGTRRSAPP